MASYVRVQDVGEPLSHPATCGNGGGQWVERWPAGGGLISRPSVPPLLRFLLAALFPSRGGGVWPGCPDGAVRTRRWGRGPAGRGLTAWIAVGADQVYRALRITEIREG